MKSTTTKKATNPIDTKQEVKQSNDKHIGQDFEGYPHSPAKENIINPKTKADKLTANSENKHSGKQNPPKKKAAKQGDTTPVEKKLASTLGGKNNTDSELNKVERIRKQKKD